MCENLYKTMEIVSLSSWTYLDVHFLNLLQANKKQKTSKLFPTFALTHTTRAVWEMKLLLYNLKALIQGCVFKLRRKVFQFAQNLLHKQNWTRFNSQMVTIP